MDKLRLLIVVLAFAAPQVAFGQIYDCWSGTTNPDGSELIPAVWLDPGSGLMHVNTLGLNQILETTDRMNIGGDDVGMISLSVEGPAPTAFLLTGFVDEVAWSANYFGGSAQVFGVGVDANFLAPNASTEVFQYSPGISPADFGSVEMAVNFGSGLPGGIIFGAVSCMPEPSSTLLVLTSCLVFVHSIRRTGAGR